VKRTFEDLAVFGGPCAFPQRLHVGRPNVGDRERLRQRFDDILDRRWLSNDGRYVAEFERRVAELTGVRHCIAMASGTTALEIAIRACDLSGEVIVPSFTFIATAHALEWQGITPVFCDIDETTFNIDPDRIETLVGPRTTGILAVHLWGRPAPVAALTEIARRRGLRLLFDAAHALGCSLRGRMVGGFGDAEVFSFHATKFVNSFEGGALVTNDDALAARVRQMKNFGFVDYDDVRSAGTNGKMSEIQAAMGLTSLESLDAFVEVNRRNYHAYRRQLRNLPGIRLLPYDKTDRCNYQYVVLEVDATAAGLTRDELVRVLLTEGVLARRYFYPGCHRMEPYRSREPEASLRLPVTGRVAARVLVLPTGSAVDEETIAGVAGLLRFALDHAPAVRSRVGRLQPDRIYEGQ
jgi:dTDP-4-amino-4,6-dideoxygalactose transaminase